MCLTIEQASLIVLVGITTVYVVLTYLILKESKNQRLQDVELRTMIKIREITPTEKQTEIQIDAVGEYPVQDWNFIVKKSGGKEIPTKGFTIGGWPRENKLFWTIDLIDLLKNVPVKEETFRLFVTARFTSFLGNNWEFKFKSVDLFLDTGMKIIPVGRISPSFSLIDVRAPWD